MQRWEYRTHSIDAAPGGGPFSVGTLTTLGREGWEAVGVAPGIRLVHRPSTPQYPDQVHTLDVLLKRPLQD